ncbi:MAG TPA: TIR domain-containing protein [Pyrinomonadaceae bacterium]|jgi:hypothetical protein|nr:TIR domain-containing protein [Pyrinomonadaceae bacterium]
MLVFISWSGQRSKAVAEALETWLAQVIQAVEPWISQDIDKGLRWGAEIADRLERSKVGIICLTKSNLGARWIHFEAGALSKTKDAYVCTLLLDIKPSDVEQPLAQFQHTTTEKEDIFQLLSTINRAVQSSGEKALAEPLLRRIFDTYWPDLEKAFQGSAALQEATASPTRTTDEMLQEMLEILRNQERRQVSLSRPMTQELTSSYAAFSKLVQPEHFKEVLQILLLGYIDGTTAHEIARVTKYPVKHIRKVLEELIDEGEVIYNDDKYRLKSE